MAQMQQLHFTVELSTIQPITKQTSYVHLRLATLVLPPIHPSAITEGLYTAWLLLLLLLERMQNTIIEQCPVIRPTPREFQNFREFVEGLDRTYKQKYGMVKVIPPKGWIPHVKDYEKRLEGLTISSPIEQNTFGKGGIYQCLHIPKKSMSFNEFKAKSQELDKITNGKTTDQIEQMFWKNVTFSAPLYGADQLSSVMDSSSKAWDLNNLDSLLSDSLQTKVKGVNTPYCYVGSWKAFFCWHTEDLDLSGVNFIHEGKSKFWYAINYQDKKIIQKEAVRLFPQHFVSCKQFLRHKTTLINPYYLKRKYPQLRISKIEHKQNEFMLVFGGSYHTGFNFGFNVAEAINYATFDWLKQVSQSKHCLCLKSSVKTSVYEIYKNLYAIPRVRFTPYFSKFQEFIFKKAEEEESQQELQQAKKGVSLLVSKKIKKAKKIPSTISFKNEQYQIQNWGQCEKCRLWRVVKRPLAKSDYFQCKKVGKECFKRQKITKSLFTIEIEPVK